MVIEDNVEFVADDSNSISVFAHIDGESSQVAWMMRESHPIQQPSPLLSIHEESKVQLQEVNEDDEAETITVRSKPSPVKKKKA
jgi:hypothetical protein